MCSRWGYGGVVWCVCAYDKEGGIPLGMDGWVTFGDGFVGDGSVR
jgi:hypothetical protein